MKNGLFFENNKLTYYKDNKPYHAGVVKENDDIYYIGKDGKAVKGKHIIHSSMTNGIIEHGTYKFGDDYKLIPGFYAPPKEKKNNKTHFRKKKPEILILLSVAFLFIAIVFFPRITSRLKNTKEEKNISFAENQSAITLHSFDTEIMLFSEDALRFYNGEISIEEVLKTGSVYRPFVFRYRIYGNEDGKLFLSENEDMSEAKEIVLPQNNISVDIYNLKTGTTYYYKVNVLDETLSGSFKTAKGPRFIFMKGLYNARDIGGYETIDGKTIKQGYLIRGAEIDGLGEASHVMEKEDIEQFVQDFGFVYDLDLRNQTVFMGEYISRLGENVKHDFYHAPAYGLVFNAQYKESIKKIFSALADEKNYPMYFHCTHGVDRTGSMIFLLQGILNVPESKMENEYYSSRFANKGYAQKVNLEAITLSLNAYEGETINQRIENFLINDIGVTKEEIDSIRKILLED